MNKKLQIGIIILAVTITGGVIYYVRKKNKGGNGASNVESQNEPDRPADDPLLRNPVAGKKVYAKVDGVNLRSSAEVNNADAWWDFVDNIVATQGKGVYLGDAITVEADVNGSKRSDGMVWAWYKIKPAVPIKGTGYKGGYKDAAYVREDVITIK